MMTWDNTGESKRKHKREKKHNGQNLEEQR